MKPRSFVGLAAVACVAAATLVMAVPGMAGARPPRSIAVCELRACVLVLVTAADSDGDGVCDIDEIRLGTDPYNAASQPRAGRIIDLLITRDLPSFERHLTELVVLPKLTPGRDQITTMLGAFPVGRHDTNLFPTTGDALMKLHGAGFGFDFGLSTHTRARPGEQSRLGQGYWQGPGRVALASNVAVGINSMGPNGSKDVSGVVGDKGHFGEADFVPEFTMDRSGAVGRRITINYTDGSRDEVTSSVSTREGSGGSEAESTSTSYDEDGKVTGKATASTSTSTDGTTTTTKVEITLVTYDSDGNVESTTNVTTTTTTGDGHSTSTIKIEITDADGNGVGDVWEETTTDPDKGDLSDPDYVSSGPITDADMARVVARINAVRRPGPDNGAIDPSTPQTYTDRWPMVALIDADAVTVLAAGGTPTFNRAQPEYDPRLAELGIISGQPTPYNDHGTIAWPS